MAASKPTSWLSVQLHILQSTKSGLGTLAGGLGCFPFDYGAYPPQSDSYDKATRYSEFDSCWYPGQGPRTVSALPPCANYIRLALKLFRGEPAITRFDWPFTPIHSSSKRFSTRNGSVLHLLLQRVQPGHG